MDWAATVAGIDSFMSPDADHVPSPVHPGAVRIAVWVALGSASWAVLGTALILVLRAFG
jgi:hypothetical protein